MEEKLTYTKVTTPWLNPNAFGKNPTPKEIRRYILSMEDLGSKDFTYIILGENGPTGKTWLTQSLIEAGFKAFEITEDIADLVMYKGRGNYFIVDNFDKRVVIILNIPFKSEEKK